MAKFFLHARETHIFHGVVAVVMMATFFCHSILGGANERKAVITTAFFVFITLKNLFLGYEKCFIPFTKVAKLSHTPKNSHENSHENAKTLTFLG